MQMPSLAAQLGTCGMMSVRYLITFATANRQGLFDLESERTFHLRATEAVEL